MPCRTPIKDHDRPADSRFNKTGIGMALIYTSNSQVGTNGGDERELDPASQPPGRERGPPNPKSDDVRPLWQDRIPRENAQTVTPTLLLWLAWSGRRLGQKPYFHAQRYRRDPGDTIDQHTSTSGPRAPLAAVPRPLGARKDRDHRCLIIALLLPMPRGQGGPGS